MKQASDNGTGMEELNNKEILPLIAIKKKETAGAKSALQKEMEKYNRLVKQLAKMDKEWETLAAEKMNRQQERVRVITPLTDNLNVAVLDFVKALDHWYNEPKALKKPDRRRLADIVLDELVDVHLPEAIEWRQRYMAYQWELSTPTQKQDTLDDLKDQGVKMGRNAAKLSGEDFYKTLHTDANREKMYEYSQQEQQEEQDLFEEMFGSFFSRFKERKPTKKEEAHKQSLDGFFKKLYKKLARLVHPDLEQDAIVRSFKEDAMKELTEAKDKEDIYSLLALRTRIYTALAVEDNDEEDEAVLLPQYKMLNKQLQEQVYEKHRRVNLADESRVIMVKGRPQRIDTLSTEGIALEQKEVQRRIDHYTEYSQLIATAEAADVAALLKSW